MSGGGLAAHLFANRPLRVLDSCNDQAVRFSTPLCNYSEAWRWRSIAYLRLCLYDVHLPPSCLISQPWSFSVSL